jgi:hypothetical protein
MEGQKLQKRTTIGQQVYRLADRTEPVTLKRRDVRSLERRDEERPFPAGEVENEYELAL